MDFRKNGAEGLRRKFGDFVKAAGRVINGLAGGIIHRQTKVQTRARCRSGFRIRDGLAERGGQSISAPNHAEPHSFVDAVRRFRKNVFVKQPQDRMDFGRGTLPIRGGKREKRKSVNANARRSLDDAARSFGSGAMAGGTRQAPRSRPAAIAVRDDRDVEPRSRGDGRLGRGNLPYRQMMHELVLSPPRRKRYKLLYNTK